MSPASPASLLATALLASIVGGTYWLVQKTLPNQDTCTKYVKRHIPDYYVDNLVISILSSTGKTQYRVNAQHIAHYEDDETTHLELPTVRAFSQDQPEVTAMSKRGMLNSDMSIIDLNDNVIVNRKADFRNPTMQAFSSHFQILINNDIIHTDTPVKLFHGQSTMNASGIILNNSKRSLQLLGNVHGTIHPTSLKNVLTASMQATP
ncbi:LPS export ABC transporter periplasmic protein LptC [Candidatus Pandoraea novymonadis]|uniref:Lipopolysaccharide export system protein LptC n=1 Tax=Candidatus Pandoraea novymonadis TaxID=1808959 RepID=A0ABX5FDF4_9BURK|nr:LPS export ABC transporter periplasmic protein LptC [Candidatus Pandoraea novymonadis]PSB91779.1 Lipopolysaccharide export system protein LptC [Candidatus Pandoraea novymonadis]